jgi:hypothetical protein
VHVGGSAARAARDGAEEAGADGGGNDANMLATAVAGALAACLGGGRLAKMLLEPGAGAVAEVV